MVTKDTLLHIDHHLEELETLVNKCDKGSIRKAARIEGMLAGLLEKEEGTLKKKLLGKVDTESVKSISDRITRFDFLIENFENMCVCSKK